MTLIDYIKTVAACVVLKNKMYIVDDVKNVNI